MLRYDANQQLALNDIQFDDFESNGDIADFYNRTIKVVKFDSNLNRFIKVKVPINESNDFSSVRNRSNLDEEPAEQTDIMNNSLELDHWNSLGENYFSKQKELKSLTFSCCSGMPSVIRIKEFSKILYILIPRSNSAIRS